MARLGRATAGRQVAALADRLSDRLAAAEDDCFAAVADAFDPGPAEKQIAGLLERATVKQVGQRKGTVPGLVAEQADCARAARAAVVGLSETATALARESIVDELRLCERTLTGAYAGLAAEVADNLADVDVAAHLGDYDTAVDNAVDAFGTAVKVQFRAAADPDELLRRLFWPTPAGLRGFGGRGVWWRTTSTVEAAARAVSIQTANTVRLQGMDAFNVLGAGRG